MTNWSDNVQSNAGRLCLEFANTVDWRGSAQPVESLKHYRDLVAWARGVGLLSDSRADDLLQRAIEQPEMAIAAFRRALEVRESLYRAFTATAGGRPTDDQDLRVINEALRTALARLRIVSDSEGFAWQQEGDEADLEQILWPVVRSAAELLTSPELERVKQCADEHGCGYLFLDTSRNRSRRWCSMDSCGNRAKARRHYQRQRALSEGAT
jgi:predicted RNA-binding Zn ribbon-like protein